MLDGDGDQLRMAYSLLSCLPGTPSFFFGEEIGMCENLDIDGRMAVRTPMQRDDGPNAGFSTVNDPSRFVRPLVHGEYDGQNGVTVAAQRDDPASLLPSVTLLASRYRDCPGLARGTVDVLDVETAAVLALRARRERGTVLAVHNLSATDVDVVLGLDGEPGPRTISDLLGTDGRYDLTDGVLSLHLSRYDTRWYRIGGR